MCIHIEAGSSGVSVTSYRVYMRSEIVRAVELHGVFYKSRLPRWGVLEISIVVDGSHIGLSEHVSRGCLQQFPAKTR